MGKKKKNSSASFKSYQNSIHLEVLIKAKFNKHTRLMFINIGNDPSSHSCGNMSSKGLGSNINSNILSRLKSHPKDPIPIMPIKRNVINQMNYGGKHGKNSSRRS